MARAGKSVIDLLNDARARELTAVMQYMAQHYELEDADFGKLAKIMKATGIQEMNHAEALAERILFLGGTPTSKPDAAIAKGLAIPRMLEADVALEQQAVAMYNESAVACGEARDHVSKQLFQRLLAEEEAHVDTFQTIKEHLAQMGDAYLATLVG
ncbi:MAG: bacterioferritin [Planctomycetes bacterium]|nr:bacterioferritin [Planctomycetota bacterium]